MNHKYSYAERQAVIDLYTNGEKVATIIHKTGISRSTAYALYKNVSKRKPIRKQYL